MLITWIRHITSTDLSTTEVEAFLEDEADGDGARGGGGGAVAHTDEAKGDEVEKVEGAEDAEEKQAGKETFIP